METPEQKQKYPTGDHRNDYLSELLTYSFVSQVCRNVMFKYAKRATSNEICTYMHAFLRQISEHRIKPWAKFLFHFADTESKVFRQEMAKSHKTLFFVMIL